MTLQITPSTQACGARITGVDLTQPLSEAVVSEIKAAWQKHHVLAFPDQQISDDDLERFTLNFGPFGDDPFIAPIEGREHIIAVQRSADETAPIFAEAWHTDWSFQGKPPIGTCLYGITIPPVGGDTLFINQQLVYQQLPRQLKQFLLEHKAVHSAQLAYAPDGAYGDDDEPRSMDIRPDESARELQLHPFIFDHPESGEPLVYGTAGYIVGIDGVDSKEAEAILMELHAFQTQERFQYRHKWQANTLLMWDNRSVLHSATGGYDGYARCLHRTTIGAT